jgi:hypothetical protein
MSGLLRTNPKYALLAKNICLFKPMVVSELSKRVTELLSPMFIRLSSLRDCFQCYDRR